jgi:hypothetical protein
VARKKKDFSNTGIQFGEADADTNSSLSGIFEDMESSAFGTDTEDDVLRQLQQNGMRRSIQARNGRIQRGNFVMTMTGLEYQGEELSLQEWREMGSWLNQLRDSIQWMIGDWANMAHDYVDTWVSPDGREFETRYAELLENTDYSYSTLRKFASIASAVPMFRRRNTLTFSHHVEVAHLPEDEQERFLNMAEPNEVRGGKRMSVRDLRERIQSEYPPDQLGAGKAKPAGAAKEDTEAELLKLGLDFVRKPPKRNATNKKKALRAAELYRKLALELEAYAND